MKYNFPRLAAFVVYCCLLCGFARQAAQAQRLDTLMARPAPDIVVPYHEIRLDGALFYLADDGQTGYELWRTDGTPAGTRRVKDIRPGRASAFVSDSTHSALTDANTLSPAKVKLALRDFRPFRHGNRLYFWADDGVTGIELWRTDGTETGTQRVTDLIPGVLSSGTQADILYGGGGRYPSRFAANGQKLLLWSDGLANYLIEADGATGAVRTFNVQSSPYLNVQPKWVQVANNRLFVQTAFMSNGKSFCSLLEVSRDSVRSIVVNQPGADVFGLVSADDRGLLYSIQTEDARSRYTNLFRRDTGGRTRLIWSIGMLKPTSGTRTQQVATMGSVGPYVLLLQTDLPNDNGKGYQEVWRLDTRTDRYTLARRYDRELSTGRLLRGSELLSEFVAGPGGMLLVGARADSMAATPNRFSVQAFDPATARLVMLDDSLDQYTHQPVGGAGKQVFLTRKRMTDRVRAWLTDGLVRQPLADLGSSTYPVGLTRTEAGLVAPVYNAVRLGSRALGYKLDVWQIDSTAARTVRVGQARFRPGGLGAVVSSGGRLYGFDGNGLLLLSAAAPDSIRPVASLVSAASLFNTNVTTQAETVHLGVVNGRVLARRSSGGLANLIALNPGAPPRQCLIGLSPQTPASVTDSRGKHLAYCPQKDSVLVFRRQQPGYGGTQVGEVTQIYYKSIQWLRDSTLLSGSSTDSIRLVKQTGLYTLSVRGVADGCVATDSWQVANDVPRVSILVQNGLQGTARVIETNLAAQVTGGFPRPTAPYYAGTWSVQTAGGIVKPIGAQQEVNTTNTASYPSTIKVVELGTYSLRITDATGCTAVGSVVLDQALKEFVVSARLVEGKNEYCAGSPIAFGADVSGGKAPYRMRWLNLGQPVTDMTGLAPTITATYAQTGTAADQKVYLLEVTDATGRTAVSSLLRAYVYPRPAATLVASSAQVSATRTATLTAGSSNYPNPSFGWSFNGKAMIGATAKWITASAAGLYSVTVGSGTSQNCRATLSTTLTDAGARGRLATTTDWPEEVTSDTDALTVMPNPTDGVSRVQLRLPQHRLPQQRLPQPILVTGGVFTPDGRTLRTWSAESTSTTYETELNLSSLPAGVYILRLEAGSRAYTRKLVRQ
ncbi:T9SS type A sorting domain-containing protein [Rudanella paleaurantiibacter]|nr:T9SS type A sorting domain-containing protein [Rudanella paleaurantiibacter]